MRLAQEWLKRPREAQFDVPLLDLWLVVGQIIKIRILWRCEL